MSLDVNQALDPLRLVPHKPLDVRDPLHVERPTDNGATLAARIVSSHSERVGFAVAGPAGSGKTSELTYVAGLLQGQFATCIVPLDRYLDMQRTVNVRDEVYARLAGRLAWVTQNNLNLPLPNDVREVITAFGLFDEGPKPLKATSHYMVSWADFLRRQIRHTSGYKPVVLFVDGLEKCSDGDARAIVKALLEMRSEVTIVLVVSPALVVGPESFELLESLTVFPIRAVPVRPDQADQGAKGREFLRCVLQARLQQPITDSGVLKLVDRAAIASGGVVRTFLQLLVDACTYARLSDHPLPSNDDLNGAIRDRADAMRRLLRDGDSLHLRQASGSSGLEVPIDRRLRFLAHGLLLEYDTGGGEICYPHPLIAPALSKTSQ